MHYYLFVTPLLAGAVCVILAAFVLQRDHRNTTHRLLCLFLLSMATAGILVFAMRASPDSSHALSWEKALMPFYVLQGVAFLHFSFVHTRTKYPGWFVPLAYLLVAAITAICAVKGNMLVADISSDRYGYYPVPGPLFYLVPASGYIFCSWGMVSYLRSYAVSPSYEGRNSYLYVIAGVCSFLLGGLFDIISVRTNAVPPIAVLGNVVFCLLVTIAILKYNLLDIHVVIRRGTAYLLMSAMVAIPYVAVIVATSRLPQAGGLPTWAYAILLVVLAVALLPLWGGLQRQVDRWFYGKRYGHLRALAEFSQEAHDISDLNRLSSSLVRLVGEALQTPGVYLLLPAASGDFVALSAPGNHGSQIRLERQSPLLRWLRSNKAPLHRRDLDIFPQLQALSGREREELDTIRAQLLVPLKTKEDNELVGVLVLCEKRSTEPYSDEDVRLVSSVASRMAVEIENARLYTIEQTMRKELERQNELKTEFLHSVAHELKTPLTAVISSAELLSEELPPTAPAHRKRLVDGIVTGAWRMNKRITELLDFARMQTGQPDFRPEPLDISQVLRDVASQYLVLFTNRGQSLRLGIADSLPMVQADKAKLEQILINLLDNANKFSPAGGTITLRAARTDGKVVVAVDDSAPAITEEERGRIFEPYYRGEDADKRQRLPGLGLGLAIVKRLVQLHHGEIWVDSTEGKGNTFAFSLPIVEHQVESADN
ncbi:MAG: ATP-binding protein [Chloroflexi bacterium]|nr:ATP-binding protein [Chloroflexota bacterium]